MTLRRQGFVAFILLTVIVCVALLPLLPVTAAPGRHHVRSSIASLVPALTFSFIAALFFSISASAERSIVVPKNLLELICSRLC
jgi:hypothetical protein